MTSQATCVMSEVECEARHPGLGSYLLLFVGLGPPASKRTSAASKDGCQVLPSTLFTVQFNQNLRISQLAIKINLAYFSMTYPLTVTITAQELKICVVMTAILQKRLNRNYL